MNKKSPIIYHWIAISVIGMIIELAKMFIDSRCGLVSMTCPRTAVFGWYWAFWITFGLGLLVSQIYYIHWKKEAD